MFDFSIIDHAPNKNLENESANTMPEYSKKPVQVHQTNWNKNPTQPIEKEKRAHMMGEGLGSSLGIENTKAVPGKPLGYYDEQKRLQRVESKQERAKNAGKRQLHGYVAWKYQTEILPKKLSEGAVLVNQRIFLCDWIKPKWDSIARNLGLPDGVDVAHTEFGELLLVPVIEFLQGIEMGINPRETPPLKDIEGRPCWVAASIRERIEAIFGRVRWTRPLTIREAEQFGVQL